MPRNDKKCLTLQKGFDTIVVNGRKRKKERDLNERGLLVKKWE